MAAMNDGGERPRRAPLPLIPKPPSRRQIRAVGMMVSVKKIKCNVVFSVLKAAWGSYDTVVMSELRDGIMAFDFVCEEDRNRVMDLSPWAIHGNCLNLRISHQNHSLEEIDFRKMQIWAQVHGLSPEMLNMENAVNIASRIGKNLFIDNEKDMLDRGYMRMKLEIDVADPVSPGFWWTNDRGMDKWAHIRYERLADLCFGCGRLGHTTQTCDKDIVVSEENNKLPMYGPWTSCPRQRKHNSWLKPGMVGPTPRSNRDPTRKTWQDMMKEGAAVEKSVNVGAVHLKLEPPDMSVPHLQNMSSVPPIRISEPASPIRGNLGSPKNIPLLQKLDLSPLRRGLVLLDLNAEPIDEEPERDVDQPSFGVLSDHLTGTSLSLYLEGPLPTSTPPRSTHITLYDTQLDPPPNSPSTPPARPSLPPPPPPSRSSQHPRTKNASSALVESTLLPILPPPPHHVCPPSQSPQNISLSLPEAYASHLLTHPQTIRPYHPESHLTSIQSAPFITYPSEPVQAESSSKLPHPNKVPGINSHPCSRLFDQKVANSLQSRGNSKHNVPLIEFRSSVDMGSQNQGKKRKFQAVPGLSKGRSGPPSAEPWRLRNTRGRTGSASRPEKEDEKAPSKDGKTKESGGCFSTATTDQ